MPIRRGEAWGEQVPIPPDLVVATTDAQVGDAVLRGRPVGLAGGDLARTVGGGTAGQFTGSTCTKVRLDLVHVTVEGQTTCSVAHVVARRSWWRGQVVLAMNAQFLGPYDVAPRGHPNDGRLDLVDVDATMGWRARDAARRRARTGTHLPHPLLHTRGVAEATLTFPRAVRIWIDGVRWTTSTEVHVRVEPDAYRAYV